MGYEKRREQRFNVDVDARVRNGTGSARQVVVSDARVKWRAGDVHGILFEHPLHQAVLEHIRYSLSRYPAYIDGPEAEAA